MLPSKLKLSLSLLLDLLKGLGRLLLFWRIYQAGKEREELNQTEKELRFIDEANANRDRLVRDKSFAKRVRDRFTR